MEEYRALKKEALIFEKAYMVGHIAWRFLDFVMQIKGLGVRWRKWIMGCLSTCNMSVIVNREAGNTFKASRGLR